MIEFDTLTLRCFIAVVQTQSFTKAAEKIGRTQSAVSQQMTKLEQQVGHKLFIRGRDFKLTTEGEKFLRYAKQIVSIQHEIVDSFKEPDLQGKVHFGLPEDFASVFLADVLAEFSRLHPRILLNVECDLTLNLFERFKKKEFDLVLVKMSQPEDFHYGTDIWHEQLVWVGSPELMQQQEVIPLVLSPHPCVYRARAIASLEQNNLQWRMVFCSASYTSTLAAVRAGMGVTVLPRNMVPHDLPLIQQGENVPLLDDTHISLLKHYQDNCAINSFETFVMARLRA